MTANTAWYRCSATLMYLMNATVTNQPKSLGHLNRSGATHHPKSLWDASPELAQKSGAPGRTRTSDTRFRKPLLYPLSYEGERIRPGGVKPRLKVTDPGGASRISPATPSL